MGDSHADAISQPLEETLTINGLGFKSFTFDGCPPALNVVRIRGGSKTFCTEQNLITHKIITSDNDLETVVMLSRWTAFLEESGYGNENIPIQLSPVINGQVFHGDENGRHALIGEQYRKTIMSYLETGKKVILIYPVPEIGWDAPRAISRSFLFDRAYTGDTDTSYAKFLTRNRRSIKALDSVGDHKNLRRIRPDKLLCNTFVKDRCVFQLNGIPLYTDDDHLNNHGAKMIVGQIEQILHEWGH